MCDSPYADHCFDFVPFFCIHLHIKVLACLCLRSEIHQIIRQDPLIYDFQNSDHIYSEGPLLRGTGKVCESPHLQIEVLACLYLRSEIQQIIRQGSLIYDFKFWPHRSEGNSRKCAILRNKTTVLTSFPFSGFHLQSSFGLQSVPTVRNSPNY